MPARPSPALVTLHVWGVPGRRVPAAVLRMGLDRRPVRRAPGLRFAKLLGTADGGTFGARDADPRHWALLACWDRAEDARRFESGRTVRAWSALADETLRVSMRPLASRGTWSGRTPFGEPEPRRVDGPVAALTRARIKPTLWRTFWRAVPPVSADLDARPGLLLALGIGEAPVGLQGTFSLWSGTDALRDFAHRGAAHQAAVAATTTLGWYAEELFARFAVEDVTGAYRGANPAPAGLAS